MARYLFGKVIVRTVLIDAATDEEANAILADTETNYGNRKVKMEHELHWGETPQTLVTNERDGVLQEFLQLMQTEIPLGSATGLIIDPFTEKPAINPTGGESNAS